MVKALYIHIPFCEKICAYCDFIKVMSGTFSHKQYLSVLLKEIDELHIPDNSLKTIYIGGGTPTALEDELFDDLLSYLHQHFPSIEEFTVEANPESLTDSKIEIAMKNGVNRISLGVQSSNDNRLISLGRNHCIKDVIDAVERLQKHHFENYNLDFIYGVRGMSLDDVEKDISFALSLNPKHLSFYSLQIEEGTLFAVNHIKNETEDMLRNSYDFICKQLSEHGFHRYEVSNFALPGYESKHNLTYWHDEEYYAAGVSASSYIGKERFTNTKSLTHYLHGENNKEVDSLTMEDEETEFLMLNLRLSDGFSLVSYQERFHKDFLLTYQKGIEKVKDYVNITKTNFSIKEEYLYTMDGIFINLIS